MSGVRFLGCHPSVFYRLAYLMATTSVLILVVLTSGSYLSGFIAAGGCTLTATCAALAVTWDHREETHPTDTTDHEERA